MGNLNPNIWKSQLNWSRLDTPTKNERLPAWIKNQELLFVTDKKYQLNKKAQSFNVKWMEKIHCMINPCILVHLSSKKNQLSYVECFNKYTYIKYKYASALSSRNFIPRRLFKRNENFDSQYEPAYRSLWDVFIMVPTWKCLRLR